MSFTLVGPYRVIKRLGRGGMGTVYQAVDDATARAGDYTAEQTVAVKVLAAALADDKDSRRRFDAEIESLKRLDHPNIVRLFGYGEQEGHAYYVMEYVAGTTLEHELQGARRFTWREVTELGIQLCRALRHAHDRGVIHRDIKPANLLLTLDGDVKLSDFGIARLFGMSGLTNSGSVVGTAEYMAPEQADGRPVSPQSDLYSLGCVLFTLLAGRTPFRGATVPETLQLQRHAVPPPVSKFATYVPTQLEKIIAQLLQKEPHDRAPNAAVLGRQLQELIDETNEVSAAQPWDDAGDSRRPSERPTEDLPPDDLAPTRYMDTDPGLRGGRDAARGKTPAPQTQGAAVAEPSAQQPAAMPRVTRHVVVEQTGQPLDASARYDRRRHALQIAAPAAGLLLIVAVVWYLSRPLTADQLFARIDSAIRSGDVDTVFDTEEDFREFLARFPNDPRAAEVQSDLEGVEVVRLDNRLGILASRPGLENTAKLTPIESELVAADRLAMTHPEQALPKLQGLITLYETDADVPNTRLGIEVARRRVDRLQEKLAQDTPERLAWLDEQLEKAAALSRTDPQVAGRIWKGIIQLYGDRSWAADRVQRARDALASRPPQPQSQPQP